MRSSRPRISTRTLRSISIVRGTSAPLRSSMRKNGQISLISPSRRSEPNSSSPAPGPSSAHGRSPGAGACRPSAWKIFATGWDVTNARWSGDVVSFEAIASIVAAAWSRFSSASRSRPIRAVRSAYRRSGPSACATAHACASARGRPLSPARRTSRRSHPASAPALRP